MKREKSFLEQELERERKSVGMELVSWRDKVRQFFLRTHEKPVRTATDDRRDDITKALYCSRYGVSADDFIKAAQAAATAQNKLDEYVWATMSDDPEAISMTQVKQLSADCEATRARVAALAADKHYKDAIMTMKQYWR